MNDFKELEKEIISLFEDSSIDLTISQIRKGLQPELVTLFDSYIMLIRSNNRFIFKKNNRPTAEEVYFNALNSKTIERVYKRGEGADMEKTRELSAKLDNYFKSDFFTKKAVADNLVAEKEGKMEPSETSLKLKAYFASQEG